MKKLGLAKWAPLFKISHVEVALQFKMYISVFESTKGVMVRQQAFLKLCFKTKKVVKL